MYACMYISLRSDFKIISKSWGSNDGCNGNSIWLLFVTLKRKRRPNLLNNCFCLIFYTCPCIFYLYLLGHTYCPVQEPKKSNSCLKSLMCSIQDNGYSKLVGKTWEPWMWNQGIVTFIETRKYRAFSYLTSVSIKYRHLRYEQTSYQF